MKKTSGDLYNLIGVLDKSEKGYFRKFAIKNSIGEEKNYIKLFDAIESQHSAGIPYDEKKIKEKFRGEKFIHQISFTKTYLYNMILKSLSSYDSGKFISSQINELMDNIVSLFRRGLYYQCLKLIKRGKKIAYKNDQYVKLYDLLRYEKNVYSRIGNADIGGILSKIYSEQKHVVEIISNITDYASLYNDAFNTIDEFGRFKGEKDENKFDIIMKNRLMFSDSCSMCFASYLYYYGINYAYYLAKNEYPKAYHYIKKMIEIQNNRPYFREKNTFSYYTEYLNATEPAIYLNKRKDFAEYIDIVEKEVNEYPGNLSKANRVYFGARILASKLMYFVRNWEPEKIPELINELEKYKKNREQVNKLDIITAYYYTGLYFFIIGEYGQALQWLNKIESEFQNDLFMRNNNPTPILSILIHYEIGNNERIDYLVKSLKRYLKKNRNYYKIEELFLGTMVKLINAGGKKDKLDILKEFRSALNKQKGYEYYNLDLDSWAESKIKGIAFSAMLEHKKT